MKTKTITFDFDNTIAMSHMDLSSDETKYVFEEYNKPIVNLIKKYIDEGHDVHIVTARVPAKEALFPKDTVRVHLDNLSLSYYFTDDRIHYTSDTPKLPTLQKLGSTLHYDDNMQEHIDNYGGIPVKNPYDFYPDTEHVAKAIIYDLENNILLLKRTDGSRQWDIPGGHLKNIEVNRGSEGFEEGLEREVAEETGLILPFSEQIGNQDFTWKDKTTKITFFLSKLDDLMPNCNLKLQGFMENDRFEWIPLDNMFKYAKNGTQVLRKGIELAKKRGILTEEGKYQLTMKRKHRTMKQKLIGKRQKRAKKRPKKRKKTAKKHYHWNVSDWYYGGGYGDGGSGDGGE
jgi:ADP-ribose pyrophosphatase YjhB (NUDIX family)